MVDILTIRDQMALSILNGFISNPDTHFDSEDIMINHCYRLAEIMLKVRDNEQHIF